MTVFVVVGQCCNGLSDTVFAAGQMHRLADNHVAFLENQQFADIGEPEAVVEAADGFTHRVNRIGERQQRVDGAEERGHHFNRVQAGGARHLQNDQRHAYAFAHVHERGGEGENHRHIHQ